MRRPPTMGLWLLLGSGIATPAGAQDEVRLLRYSDTVEVHRRDGTVGVLRYFDKEGILSDGDRLVVRGKGSLALSLPDQGRMMIQGPADLHYFKAQDGPRRFVFQHLTHLDAELGISPTWLTLQEITLSGVDAKIVVHRELHREIDVRHIRGNPLAVEAEGRQFTLRIGERVVFPDFYDSPAPSRGPTVVRERPQTWNGRLIEAPPRVEAEMEDEAVVFRNPASEDAEKVWIRVGGSTVVLGPGEWVRLRAF